MNQSKSLRNYMIPNHNQPTFQVGKSQDYFYIFDEKYSTTVAYTVNSYDPDRQVAEISIGAAHCYLDKDSFNKKLGRTIASGRLNKKPTEIAVAIAPKPQNPSEFWRTVRYAISSYFTNGKIRALHNRNK